MTAIAILPESVSATEKTYRAVAGVRQSLGKTPGEALDRLTAQFGEEESGALVVVQQMKPDRFFSEAQRKRLAHLMNEWRAARDSEQVLPAEAQAELEALVATELEAATQRARAMLDESKP